MDTRVCQIVVRKHCGIFSFPLTCVKHVGCAIPFDTQETWGILGTGLPVTTSLWGHPYGDILMGTSFWEHPYVDILIGTSFWGHPYWDIPQDWL